jgi:chain length determinant protein EpsF
MSFAHLLAVLRARWIAAVAVFTVVLLAAVLYVIFVPRLYTATSTLLIEAKPDPVSTMLYGGSTSPALINTQLEVIRSDRVALRVIQNLKLAEMADLRSQWDKTRGGEGSFQDWLITILQSGLDAGVSKAGGSVITIGFRASDPRFAAAVANAYMQAYLETSVELRVDPAKQYSSFFAQQAKEARETLEASQAKLSAFQREHGLIVNDERLDVEMKRLDLLSQELVSAQATSDDSANRQVQAKKNADRISEVLTNNTVAGLRTELATSESKLQELRARYGDNHPSVQEAQVRVDELKKRLAAETGRVSGGVGVTAKLSAARVRETQASLDRQSKKLLALKAVRDEGAVLSRDVENAQKSYDLILTRFNQTTLESQNLQSNATVISQASPPSKPSSPKVLANLVIGLAAALGLGLGSALALEQADKRVRTVFDVTGALGLPVIGIMPTPSTSRRVKGQIDQRRQRVISGRRLLDDGSGIESEA